jgi:hypothetical protein
LFVLSLVGAERLVRLCLRAKIAHRKTRRNAEEKGANYIAEKIKIDVTDHKRILGNDFASSATEQTQVSGERN